MKKFNKIIILISIIIFIVVGLFILNDDIFKKVEKSVPQIKDSYPLVVYGGEPEGIMAAVAAARQDQEAPVLLVMKRQNPGGLMTYGGLNYLDLNYDSAGNIINQGLFTEWYNKMGRSVAFSIGKAKQVFSKMIDREDNITLLRKCNLLEVKSKKGNLQYLKLKYNGEVKKVKANKFIDASQNAELAVKAGVDYFNGGADRGLSDHHMAVTLILHMDNINWDRLKLEAEKNTYGTTYIDKDHAWGFVEIGDLYQPKDNDIRLRGLNIVRANNSEVYINSMLIFNVDPTDKKSLKKAYKSGKKEAEHVLDFLQKNLKGFKNAQLLDFPEELYVRESRHIIAERQLKTDDQFANKIFHDTIALGAYPLDYQASVPEYNGFVLFNPDIYGIPFRSLIPADYENLLVVGRSSGYSSLAAASSRVLPTGMATGEAAGISAVMSERKNVDFMEFYHDKNLIDKLQKKIFPHRKITTKTDNILKEKKLTPHLKNLLSWGLVIGGYNNEFKLDLPIKEKKFAHILLKGLQRRKSPILYEWVPGSLETLSKKNTKLTLNRAAMLLLAATSHRVLDMKPQNYYNFALKDGLISETNNHNKQVNKNKIITHREAYVIISNFLQKYPLPKHLKKLRGVE